MTREEAISWLTNEKWKNANNKYKKEWNEAFDMAIEALTDRPYGRLINADALKRRAITVRFFGKDIMMVPTAEIDDAPTIKRPKGEWHKVDEQPYFRKHFDNVCCSVCQHKGMRKYNYCPNCGADMRGDNE